MIDIDLLRKKVMRKAMALSAIGVMGMVVFAYGESEEITITTYYPSPQGVYNKLQANSLGVGDNDGDGRLDSDDVPANPGEVRIAGGASIAKGAKIGGIWSSDQPEMVSITQRKSSYALRIDSNDKGYGMTIFAGSDNNIALNTSNFDGTKQGLKVTSNGKVGIGMEDPPEYPLHVDSDFTTEWAAKIRNARREGKGLLVQGGTSNQIAFQAQHANAENPGFTVLANGKVGIGMVSPDYPLHVEDSTKSWAAKIRNAQEKGKGLIVQAGDATSNEPAFQVQPATSISAGFTVLPNGSVGIKTEFPNGALDVNGDIRTKGIVFMGYQRVEGAWGENTSSVDCPGSKKIIGGGCLTIGKVIYWSYPSDENTWSCGCSSSNEVRAYGICANIDE